MSSTCFAAPTWSKFIYFQNWGGLNDNLASTEIQDNEASDIQNIVYDTGGSLKKRYGYTTIPNSPVLTVSTGPTLAVTGLSFYKKSDGNRYLVSVENDNGKCYISSKTYDVGGGIPNTAWSILTNSSILPTSYSNNYLPSFTTAEDKLVIAVPSTTGHKPFAFSGGSNVFYLTADANCPKASIVAYHKNHLFLNDHDNPSRIWFSNLDDITTYTATDFIDIQTNDGTKVRGMVSAFDSLYIFKDKSIWRLSGYDRDSWRLEKMVSDVGTLSHQSIAIVNNLIYFTTSQNDIAIYDGSYGVQFISTKIRGTIGGLNFSRATNNLGIGFSTYKYNDYDYYVSTSLAGSGTNNKVLLFDTSYRAWSKFSGINANAWCVGEDSVGKNILFFGDYSGYVHYYPSSSYFDGNVATSAISAYYQTKWFKYSELSLSDKYWRLLKTYVMSDSATGATLTIDCRSDYQSVGKELTPSVEQAGDKWGIMYWGTGKWAGSYLIIDRQEVEKGNNMFQIKYSNSTIYQGLNILGWEMFIEPSERI